MQPSPFRQLLTTVEQLIPGIEGELPGSSPDLICVDRVNRTQLEQLYQYWQCQYPEAGPVYWRTRGWNLLCWQPLWLGVIGVYAVGALPSQLGFISQRYRAEDGLVYGFSLPDEDCVPGLPEQLIALMGDQLRPLYTELLDQFTDISGIRERAASLLLAEQLLDIFVKMQPYRPELSASQVRDQAALWLQALGLPELHLSALQQQGSTLCLLRHSCCQHYRRRDGELCDNCPRVWKSQNKNDVRW